MSIDFKCTQCGTRLRVPDSAVGKKAKCQCGYLITVPPPDNLPETVITGTPKAQAHATNISRGNANLVGSTIGGYRITKKIGQGGMGAVWLASDANLQRDVAIKTLNTSVFADDNAYNRFLQEAKSNAKLFSKHTVAVITAGKDGNTPYIVMEYVEGASVGEILRREKRLSVDRAIDYIKQAARGLADAHDLGIIHRDIKPDNLLVNRMGFLKVADFGLARITTKEDERLTTTGQIMGTPAFMSPEQAEGQEADFRTDIYSLGATLYNMITGEPPFKGPSTLRILMSVVENPLPEMNSYLFDVPPQVQALVRKMMAKNPAERQQSYEELLDDLGALVLTRGPVAATYTEELPMAEIVTPQLVGANQKLWIGIAALLVVGIVLTIMLTRGGNSPTITPPTAAVNQPEQIPVWATNILSPEQIKIAQADGVAPAIEEDLGNGVKVRMVYIPAGDFTMGAPKKESGNQKNETPKHAVRISQPFYLSVYECTQAQWRAVMGENPASFQDDNNPVEQVSWDDIQQYIAKLNEPSPGKFKLPCEAEWEYACRAGNAARFFFGNDPGGIDFQLYGWCVNNSQNKTNAVGTKLPNKWGLYDMSGNVWEWCEDDYHETYADAPKEATPWVDSPRGKDRVLRGGCWLLTPGRCRSAVRLWISPSEKSDRYGFRLAREVIRPAKTESTDAK